MTQTRSSFPETSEQAETRLLEVVRTLALELHPERPPAVALDSDLDRDLGYDSLGRAELLLRLNRSFDVRLPDRLIADAATPADLLDAVLDAAPGRLRARGRGTAARPLAAEPAAAPAKAETLTAMLAAHVAANPQRPHVLLWQSESEESAITYGDLDRAARRVACGLLERGLRPGERVAIMLPTEAAFFQAFYGVLMAGAVPVPIYPPLRRAQLEDHLRRQARILANAGAAFLITSREIRQVGALLHGLVEQLRAVVSVDDVSASGALPAPLPLAGGDTALIQYTSGSTGDPKGVVLSHANLLANIRAMGEASAAGSGDVMVSWLPLYHDMGLIGAWLGSLYYGAPAVIMSPLAFLADPGRWLWAMHRHRATISAAPNFGFELCVKRIADEDIEGLDLSSLRMIVNGAEPISPLTIERFTERFARAGLRPQALAPVYGLAECSVGLAFPPPGRGPLIDRVERAALTREGRAVTAAAGDAHALTFVACGQPLPGHQVRVIDATGREAPERREGRLQFQGPSATSGYFRNEAKTRELFDGDWLETGDLAYIAGGDIYITGRIKDLIIRAGRNIYPHELEEVVGDVDGVRKGCVAVFASGDERSGTERLVVLAETRLAGAAVREALAQRIAEASLEVLDRPPDRVELVPAHAVPKTSSGKIRRSAARALFERGELGRGGRALWWQLARLALAGAANRARRGLAIAAAVLYAVYWWVLVCAFGAMAWLLVLLLPGRDARHALIGAIGRALLRLTGTRLALEEEAPLPEGATILVCNHMSYLDALVLHAAIPGRLSFVAKQALASQLVAGPFLKRLGTLFVRRKDPAGGLEDTAAILAAARAGARIVSFAEGTLTRMPGLLGFRLGPFTVAAEAGVPVVPVAIGGTRSLLRGGQWFPRRGNIRVHVSRAIAPEGRGFEAAVTLRDAVRAEILDNCGEPDLARERVEIPS